MFAKQYKTMKIANNFKRTILGLPWGAREIIFLYYSFFKFCQTTWLFYFPDLWNMIRMVFSAIPRSKIKDLFLM